MSQLERLAVGVVALATALAGVARYASGFPHVGAFALATVALAGTAWLVAFATEQVGERLGPALGGVLQSTVGNLPEFFVVVFALDGGQLLVAQTALVGSILVNALLVLGLVIVAGARRAADGVMRFSPRLPNDTATLLLVATFIIVVIGLLAAAHDPAARHARTISIVAASALLGVYGLWIGRYLRTEQPPERVRAARLGAPAAVALLVAAGAASAFVSEWFVHALRPTVASLHISKAFAGLVVAAIAGNAVEHLVGVVLAARGRPELAIAVVKNSVSQIAAFLYPLLVLVSLLTATALTFALAPVYIGALFGAAVIVWQITGDGEATVFEGAALVVAFVVLATVAAYQ